MTLTERLRSLFGQTLNSMGRLLAKLGIKPDMVTLLGVIGSCIGAYFIQQGNLQNGAWIVLASGLLDALDGALARESGNLRPFGALLDSVADRVSEIAIMLGLMLYFLDRRDETGCLLVLLALSGSLLVSYVRARSQSLGSDPKVGILTRVERCLVIFFSLVFAKPLIGLGVLTVLTFATILQRIFFAWKELH